MTTYEYVWVKISKGGTAPWLPSSPEVSRLAALGWRVVAGSVWYASPGAEYGTESALLMERAIPTQQKGWGVPK